jgi:hypothetical protein
MQEARCNCYVLFIGPQLRGLTAVLWGRGWVPPEGNHGIIGVLLLRRERLVICHSREHRFDTGPLRLLDLLGHEEGKVCIHGVRELLERGCPVLVFWCGIVISVAVRMLPGCRGPRRRRVQAALQGTHDM